tara:strand:- start:255 stop:1127 length:873 start_codon:yes stop_codon:yes gene_type:complete
MARIVDKDTRLIDCDFGPLTVSASRTAGDTQPTTVTSGGNGAGQLIRFADTFGVRGSFIQYTQVDLSMMTLNNEVMQPIEVSVQRTSPVPLGSNQNGNDFDQIEEFIYIFSRPLNNQYISDPGIGIENLRSLGLDRSQTINTDVGGEDAGIPTHEQTIYAEKRMYSYNSQLMATQNNGALTPSDPAGTGFINPFVSLAGMPVLDSVTTWGTMSAITGPQLHCYRVVINRTQTLPTGGDVFTAQALDGLSSLQFPPVNVTFLCKDPNYSEGEYLTRLANAMNSIPEDGRTA